MCWSPLTPSLTHNHIQPVETTRSVGWCSTSTLRAAARRWLVSGRSAGTGEHGTGYVVRVAAMALTTATLFRQAWRPGRVQA
jgi:hypothetical protein